MKIIVIIFYLTLLVYLSFKKEKNMVSEIYETYKPLSIFKKINIISIFILITPILFIFYIMVWIETMKLMILILINFKRDYVIEYPIPEGKIMFIGPYIEVMPSIIRIIKNITYKSKKNGFLRIYAVFNKDKKIDAKLLESIFFRYLFRIPLYLAKYIIILIRKIDKTDSNKVFKIRIKSKIKEFIVGIIVLTEERPSMAWKFKIIIKNGSVWTNGYNDIANIIIVKSNSKTNTFFSLGHIYKVKNSTKFNEHLKMEIESKNYSLTSSPKVYYRDEYGEEKSILTNEIGKQNNGKIQYALRYEEGKDFSGKFSDIQDLNIHMVRKFGIEKEKEFIGFIFKKHIEILAKNNWNVLNRGLNSYEYNITEMLNKECFDMSKLLYGVSNLDTYNIIAKKIEVEKVFALKGIYYNHNKKFNYYTVEEWEKMRKNQILNKELENKEPENSL